MSNRVYLTSTIFTNKVTGETSEGFRIYDDYSCHYNNQYGEYGINGKLPDDDLDLLSEVIRLSKEGEYTDFSNFIYTTLDDMDLSIEINGNNYSYEDYKDLLQ